MQTENKNFPISGKFFLSKIINDFIDLIEIFAIIPVKPKLTEYIQGA